MDAIVLLALVAAPPPSPSREVGVPIGEGTTAPRIRIEAPAGGWTTGRMFTVSGRISDPTIDPVTLSINGDRYFIRTVNGRFSRSFPAASGKNVITAMATNRGGTSRARVVLHAEVPPVPLKAVLTSDTDGVWTDLHVYEPTEESAIKLEMERMAHVFWADTASPSGGTFYLNQQAGGFDRPGYGPYLYVHRAPPRGVFLFSANYWPSGDKPHTRATLNLTLFEGTPKERRRRVDVPLAIPGTTRALAWVVFDEGGGASIYAPGVDPVPSGAPWPEGFREDATKVLEAIGGSSW